MNSTERQNNNRAIQAFKGLKARVAAILEGKTVDALEKTVLNELSLRLDYLINVRKGAENHPMIEGRGWTSRREHGKA
jgi:hypothetical protein